MIEIPCRDTDLRHVAHGSQGLMNQAVGPVHRIDLVG